MNPVKAYTSRQSFSSFQRSRKSLPMPPSKGLAVLQRLSADVDINLNEQTTTKKPVLDL